MTLFLAENSQHVFVEELVNVVHGDVHEVKRS